MLASGYGLNEGPAECSDWLARVRKEGYKERLDIGGVSVRITFSLAVMQLEKVWGKDWSLRLGLFGLRFISIEARGAE